MIACGDMSGNLRQCVGSRVALEREQPFYHKDKYSYLPKKKDNVVKENRKKKQSILKQLDYKVRFRNPKEYSFKMVNSMLLKNGNFMKKK